MRLRYGAVIVGAMLSCSASGGVRNYVASIDQSHWNLETASPLQCTLTHTIPNFGTAVFNSRAGRSTDLNFVLEMKRKPERATRASLRSVAPSWRPGVPARRIVDLTYQAQFDAEVPKQAAWVMLSELEQGMQPTFYYQDWYNPVNQVAVGLSSANFQNSYFQFVACIDSLLPYSFEDIAFTVLNFREKNGELTSDSRRKLERIREYLSYDPTLELVLIDSYTDSFGSEAANLKLSHEQADKLKQFFVDSGINAERIVSQGHGEKRHIASNTSNRGRAQNRRVVIRMER
ncbi:OmpA family protein [Ferrimonas sediminicola]|uniref:OmpA family protein n=1 Tax=Ferrimonas sediminicola TaxID=2569538 RepID=A0A4U1BFZ6_9GAMM|nr:OmpA family protein [Ferrimonas sediminicola]TKB50238.1 OmpA family protein [Ferrimonas sediminicola]